MTGISDGERRAIKDVLEAGRCYGYGNMMQHMATAWAKSLMDEYGFDEKTARNGALLQGYPFQMQDDLVERGEWDETDERYKAQICAKE